nr:uncharacterized protein LOC129274132 [Lytechinus pictus]
MATTIMTNALLAQIKATVALSRHLHFDPPHQIDVFFHLIEMYPLLCGVMSELQPRNGALFWDTYGDWLLHKVNHPVPSFDSPMIGPAAHRADIKALKFATHHLWPASYWRDKHCYRCFIKELGARPLRLSSNQCARHACQSWVRRLLDNLHEQQPGFSPRDLLPRRDGRSSRRRRSKSKSPARQSSRKRTPTSRQPEGHQITMISSLTDPLTDEEDTGSSPRRRNSSRGSGYYRTGNIKQEGLSMDHDTPVLMFDDVFDD